MNLASQVFQGLYAEASPRQFGGLDLSHWFSTRQVHAQEGSLLKGFPTWRYRVLRTALRLRPRRALSSASGQKCILAQNISNQKIFELFNVTDLTNHIPASLWQSLSWINQPSTPTLSTNFSHESRDNYPSTARLDVSFCPV